MENKDLSHFLISPPLLNCHSPSFYFALGSVSSPGHHFLCILNFLSHFCLHPPYTNTAMALYFMDIQETFMWGGLFYRVSLVFLSLALSTWSISAGWHGMRGVWPKKGLLKLNELSCLISDSCCALARRYSFPNLKHKFHLISDMN